MLNAYLIDPITLRHMASRDEWQTPTWTDLALMGRVEWSNKLVRNSRGEEVVSAARVYLPGSVSAVTNDDRIIIDGVEHAIISVQKRVFVAMISHWEIYIA